MAYSEGVVIYDRVRRISIASAPPPRSQNLSTSFFSLSIVTSLPVSLTGGSTPSWTFLIEVPVKAFLVLPGMLCKQKKGNKKLL